MSESVPGAGGGGGGREGQKGKSKGNWLEVQQDTSHIL